METAVFIFSKIVGAAVRVDTWILLALAWTVWAMLRGSQKLALAISALTLVSLILLALLPVGYWALSPLEQEYAVSPDLEHVDGIVVVGGGEDVRASTYWKQPQLNEGGERTLAGIALARRFPEATLVFTGGSGRLKDAFGATATEAEVFGKWAADFTIDPNRLLLEARSRNSAENARRSFTLAKPKPGETWVLITSAFHMHRAELSFQAAGWDQVTLTPWPVDFRTAPWESGLEWNLMQNIDLISIALKERIGRFVYKIRGR